jgi:hypothetical protein
MPPQIQADQAQPGRAQSERDLTAEAADRVSRRSLLRGAAGVGAAGLAVAVGGAAFAAADQSSPRPATTRQPAAFKETGQEPVVVYLRDIASGEFEVFNGVSQTTIRNPALAAQLLDSMKTA